MKMKKAILFVIFLVLVSSIIGCREKENFTVIDFSTATTKITYNFDKAKIGNHVAYFPLDVSFWLFDNKTQQIRLDAMIEMLNEFEKNNNVQITSWSIDRNDLDVIGVTVTFERVNEK